MVSSIFAMGSKAQISYLSKVTEPVTSRIRDHKLYSCFMVPEQMLFLLCVEVCYITITTVIIEIIIIMIAANMF